MTPQLFDPPNQSTGIPNGNPLAVVVDCDQRSASWHSARLGIVTASNACNIVTSRGEPCKGEKRQGYLNALIGERISRTIETGHNSAAMERGVELEPDARSWYAFSQSREVKEVGFVYRDHERTCGCSPDGLCEDRAVEIKCPMRKTMIGYLLKGGVPTCHIVQTQFQLFVTGLPALDYVLYTDEPNVPNFVCTVYPEPKIHAAFVEHIGLFIAEVEEGVKKIESLREV